jgi:uncharacterized protein
VQRDYAVALAWFRRAAEQGDANAVANLGIMYENGYGVAKDRAEAIAHYLKAADMGSDFARQCLKNLGVQQ